MDNSGAHRPVNCSPPRALEYKDVLESAVIYFWIPSASAAIVLSSSAFCSFPLSDVLAPSLADRCSFVS